MAIESSGQQSWVPPGKVERPQSTIKTTSRMPLKAPRAPESEPAANLKEKEITHLLLSRETTPVSVEVKHKWRQSIISNASLAECLSDESQVETWRKQVEELLQDDPETIFAKDIPRMRYVIGGKEIFGTKEDKKQKVENEISRLLASAQGLQGRLANPEQYKRLECQIKNLLHQQVHVIDLPFFHAFNQRYLDLGAQPPVMLDSVTADEFEANKSLRYELSLSEDGTKAYIQGSCNWRIFKGDEEHYGYDATHFTITIDLTKVKDPNYLLTEGATQVRVETTGFSDSVLHSRVQPLLERAGIIQEEKVSPISEERQKPYRGELELRRLVKGKALVKWKSQIESKSDFTQIMGISRMKKVRQPLSRLGLVRPDLVNQFQNLLRADRYYLDSMGKRLGAEVVPILDIPENKRTPEERQIANLTYCDVQVEGDRASITGMSYVRVLGKKGEILGYDAIRYSVNVDVKKATAKEGLFAEGAARVNIETLGVRRRLDEFYPYQQMQAKTGSTAFTEPREVNFSAFTGEKEAHPKTFLTDVIIRQEPLRIQGKEQPAEPNVIGDSLRNRLKAIVGLNDEQIEKLRQQIEALTGQATYGIDKGFFDRWIKEYAQKGGMFFGVEGIHHGFDIDFTDSEVVIRTTRYFQIKSQDASHSGYDAIHTEIRINLKAINPDVLLLTPGCATVTTRTNGFAPTLEEIPV